MVYRHLTASTWSSHLGSFNPTLAKGPLSTTWIWNLHSTPHDFTLNDAYSAGCTLSLSRRILAVGVAHVAIILFWISGMLFHGSYFSNYLEWLRDPLHVHPTAHLLWPIVGQEISNADVGGYTQGIYITSGLFHLWRAQGFVAYAQIKAASLASFIAFLASGAISFYIMHIWPITNSKLVSYKSLVLLAGLASISWSGHIIHISLPIEKLLLAGVDPSLISAPHDFLSRTVMQSLFQGFGQSPNVTLSCFVPEGAPSQLSSAVGRYMGATAAIPLYVVAAHHIALGIVLISLGLALQNRTSKSPSTLRETGSALSQSWHAQLSLSLLVLATMSFVHCYAVYSAPVYPYLACDYPSVVSLYCHHAWIGAFLMVGHGAHASICLVSDFNSSGVSAFAIKLLSQRDIIIGHLTWVVIFLGFHSFGLYIHNDTLQALGRPEDTFSDTAIQLKPIFSTLIGYAISSSQDTACYSYIQTLGSKIYSARFVLGTSDFMIHHIHAFTIHTSALILLKGLLYSRSSRLVADKHGLGFRYPCDGPGRGGTCQISPWDHIFLALFWMYNSVSILIFHFYWKLQSDVWGSFSSSGATTQVSHLTAGDFASNSNSINGWLRSFLWSQSSQVIQSYSTSISPYSLIFLGSHLLWAFSLMFLYSGRGYWQELIESIVWAHYKLQVVPHIQPRALSITQGRAVGVSHYILGGIGCTWSFFISRMVALS